MRLSLPQVSEATRFGGTAENGMLVFDAIGKATLDATPESGNSLKSALALRQHGIPHRIRVPNVVESNGFGTRCRVPSRKAPAGCRRNRRLG
jgi:hypothetical protein